MRFLAVITLLVATAAAAPASEIEELVRRVFYCVQRHLMKQ